jgi:hypothetical protein
MEFIYNTEGSFTLTNLLIIYISFTTTLATDLHIQFGQFMIATKTNSKSFFFHLLIRHL